MSKTSFLNEVILLGSSSLLLTQVQHLLLKLKKLPGKNIDQDLTMQKPGCKVSKVIPLHSKVRLDRRLFRAESHLLALKTGLVCVLFINFRISITHVSPLSAATASCNYQWQTAVFHRASVTWVKQLHQCLSFYSWKPTSLNKFLKNSLFLVV